MFARQICLAAAVTFSLGTGPLAWAQVWVPNEVLISSQKDLLDPEFNQVRGEIVWGDEAGNLWVCSIDRATGALTVPNGKGILVDSDAMRTNDVLKTGNGPEWAWRIGGDAIVYTKFEGAAHSIEQARIGYAVPTAGGGWMSGFLGPQISRRAPYGSETLDDPSPRITYVDAANNHFWRDIERPETEQLIPGVSANVAPVRHVRGARALIYAGKTSGRGGKQVFYQNLDTGFIEQLTTDAKDKDVPLMWKSPEFSGEFIFLTIIDRRELRIYRKLPPAGGGSAAWTPISSSFAPVGYSIVSPEPFSFNGKSYVALALVEPNNEASTEIWIANIDALNPIMKRVSDNTTVKARTDPEPFVTDQGPFIYYNRRQVTVKNNGGLALCTGAKCSDGLYRADTGIRE